jgi:hypothetical protein
MTLIEVVMAAALLAVTTIMCFMAMTRSQKVDAMSRERMAAREATGQWVEKLMAVPFQTVDNYNGRTFNVGYIFDGTGNAIQELLKPPGLGYVGNIVVDSTINGDAASAETVTITTRWRSAAGTVNVQTYTFTVASH